MKIVFLLIMGNILLMSLMGVCAPSDAQQLAFIKRNVEKGQELVGLKSLPASLSEKEENALAHKIRLLSQDKNTALPALFLAQELLLKIRNQFPEVSDQEYEEAHRSTGMALFKKGKSNTAKAIEVLIRESQLRSAPAQLMLHVLYYYLYYYPSKESLPFRSRILNFFKSLAEEGNARERFEYGKILLNGIYVPKDVKQGLELLEKSEMSEAYMELASYYKDKGDREKFEKYLIAAAGLGDPQALYNLGVFNMERNDYEKAIDFFEKALKIKPNYYNAKHELARMYLEGWGVKKNISYGLELMEQVASQSEDPQASELAKQNILRVKRSLE